MNYCGAPDAGGSQVQCLVRPGFGEGYRFSLEPSRIAPLTTLAVEELHAL